MPAVPIRLAAAAALVTLAVHAPSAQSPVDRIRGALGGAPGPGSFVGGDSAVTTSADQAVTAVEELDGFEPAAFVPLDRQRQDGSGAFHLEPGAYEFHAASYCLHPGTHGPGGGDGYLYAPLEGSRRSVIRAILQNSVAHPDIPQQEVQVLLWAILARTPLHQMPRRTQLTVARLLTPAQALELGVGEFRAMTPGIWGGNAAALTPALARVFEAESRLRQLFSSAGIEYAELERVAVLLGDPAPDPASRNVPSGRWSYHPEGYFVRFFPSGYSKTRIQIYVPEPVTIERDPRGRITSITDRRGRRVATSHASRVAGDDGGAADTPHAGWAFRSVAAASGAATDGVSRDRGDDAELAQFQHALSASSNGGHAGSPDRTAHARELAGMTWARAFCERSNGCARATPHRATIVDLSETVAVPGERGRQRLAQSGRAAR